MATAIRDDNPVIFFHHYLLTLTPGEVPEGEHLVPFGSASIVRPGSDVTIVATGWLVARAVAAAERLAGEGVSAGDLPNNGYMIPGAARPAVKVALLPVIKSKSKECRRRD
jgi:deoxyxylulose-5-phosphate synthase